MTVNLIGALGTVIASTTTAADGTFSFDGLPDGDYSLAISDNGMIVGEGSDGGVPKGFV